MRRARDLLNATEIGGGGGVWDGGGEAGEEEVVEEEEAATVACGSDLAVQASKLTK